MRADPVVGRKGNGNMFDQMNHEALGKKSLKEKLIEAAIILQISLGENAEAAVIGGLLALNAALGFFQEGRAQATLAALKKRLAMTASVRRAMEEAGMTPGA